MNIRSEYLKHFSFFFSFCAEMSRDNPRLLAALERASIAIAKVFFLAFLFLEKKSDKDYSSLVNSLVAH